MNTAFLKMLKEVLESTVSFLNWPEEFQAETHSYHHSVKNVGGLISILVVAFWAPMFVLALVVEENPMQFIMVTVIVWAVLLVSGGLLHHFVWKERKYYKNRHPFSRGRQSIVFAAGTLIASWIPLLLLIGIVVVWARAMFP